jgi:signal peptidase II
VAVKHTRIYDGLALLTAFLVVALDQWTKALVVAHLGPPDNGNPTPLIGNYLSLYYIQNSGAAFGLFSNSLVLIILIVAAMVVISYLYVRTLNTGTLVIKLIFGMIMGGALGNLIDRARHSGYVVDFIFFRIPQIGFRFAIFNLADAAISVGVFLLLVILLFGSLHRKAEASDNSGAQKNTAEEPAQGRTQQSGQITPSATNSGSGAGRPADYDA